MNKPVNIAELQQKSKLPVKQAGGSTVAAFFEQNKGTIASLLPKHVTADRMMKIALGAIRTTPKLQDATSQSLFGAIVTCAQLGLEPNTPAGHAYLIPFRNNKKNRTDVQVIIGYRGLIDLARRSGQIVSISAHAVFAQDEFSYEYGLEEHCKHVPSDGNRGDITHFYAVAKLVGGGYAFEVMSREAVENTRNNSSNWKTAVRFNDTGKSIWTLHFEEMGRKTVIRKLYKYLPTSIEMARADVLDSKGSTGEAQNLSHTFDGEYTAEAPANDYSDDGADKPITDSTGEIFNETDFLDPNKRNQDGTFTKRPKRHKQASEPAETKTDANPMTPFVQAMEAAKDIDELQEARESANGPAVGFNADQHLVLDAKYRELVNKLNGSGQSEDDAFAGME